MGFLSSSMSVSRYWVEKNKDDDDSVLELVRDGLTKNAVSEIEDEYAEIAAGWTPHESPYDPDFEKFPMTFGTYFLFSLRIDKKKIPAKIIQKQTAIEIAKRLKKAGRDFISKNEKTDIKDMIIEKLMRQIPSTPNIYDVLWDYDQSSLYFLTTQKAANETFETLFRKSFDMKLIKIFPFTLIETSSNFSDKEKDQILNLTKMTMAR